jgi:hypothetical protein
MNYLLNVIDNDRTAYNAPAWGVLQEPRDEAAIRSIDTHRERHGNPTRTPCLRNRTSSLALLLLRHILALFVVA